MATVIKASCHDCGDVELVAADLRVRRCSEAGGSTYVFRCPGCRMPVVKPADPRVVDLLLASGVPMEEWKLPGELREPHGGPPVTHDDLIDFHELLGRDDWFQALARGTTERSSHDR